MPSPGVGDPSGHPRILAVGRVAEREVVEDEEVIARQTICLTLLVDHRMLDGAEGAHLFNESESSHRGSRGDVLATREIRK